jgi:hypothetical protein
MEQMIARLLAKMKAKMKAGLEKMTARLEAKIGGNHKKLMVTMEASHERMLSCLEKMEACRECNKPISEEMECEAEHREVPKEHAAVKPFGALKKRYRGWHLAARRHGKLKEWTQGNGGSWKNLAAASRGMTRRAGMAWRKG